MSTAIVWFRRDLRCSNNPALAQACKDYQSIIPLYIGGTNSQDSLGQAQAWWLYHSLLALEKELNKKTLRLCLRRGQALPILKELIKQHQVSALYWNRCYEPALIERDKHIKNELSNAGIKVFSFNGSLLNEPWTIKNKSGSYFKVFSPYWKQCLTQVRIPEAFTLTVRASSPDFTSEQLNDWHLLPEKPNWAKKFCEFWEPGEQGAEKKLQQFIKHHLHSYKEYRNQPSKLATSRLSAHLHFGEISPWQIWRLVAEAKAQPHFDLASADHFLTELGWREFSYYLLYHYPDLPNKNFRREFDNFAWQKDEVSLKRWQQGLTGFPIVDAGMRELWHSGYIHNRVRMIVASFLSKDLLIDWRKGAEWFWHCLLDADLANNSASWQWVAGTGADAAPYFRIFNPSLQGEKFDPQGKYVKTWVPELALVPSKWIHRPWEAPKNQLPIILDKDYPCPMVDHHLARTIALEHYKSLIHPPGSINS